MNKADAKILIINSDDWSGLYIDNELYTEGHQIERCELVEAMKKANSFDVLEIYVDPEAFWDTGSCPNTREELLKMDIFED